MAKTIKTRSKRVQALQFARDLLAKPRGWTKNTSSRILFLKNGEAITAYCATGAIGEAVTALGYGLNVDRLRGLLRKTLKSGKGHSVESFNDLRRTRKKDILALFDKTIKGLTKRGTKR